MAEKMELVNDSGSHERVALDLMKFIMQYASDKKPLTKDELLALYGRCRGATFKVE